MPKQDKELFKDIDSFLSWYKSKMPDQAFLVKNKARYETIFNSINTIRDYVRKVSPDAKTEVRHGDLNPSAIYLKIISDEFIFEDIKGFCAALSEGSNIEFYPLTDGKISMAILFDSAYSPAPSYDELHKND